MRVLRRMAPAIAAVSALTSLATYALLGFFSRWIADDFCTAAAMKAEGFWRSQATAYRMWSGRFAFAFVMNVVESCGPFAARVVPALTIMCWVAAATFAARRLVRTTWLASLAYGLVFVSAAIDGAPDSFQSLLWQTGALTYLAPLVFLTLWTACLARDRVTVAGVVLPFLAGGFSETSVICQVVALTIALAIGPKRRIIGAALAASLVAMAIVAAAPGNAIRRARFPPSPDLAVSLANTVTLTINFLSQTTILNIAGLLLVVCVIGLFATARPSPRVIVTVALALIAATAAAFFASVHTMTLTTPARALVIPETLLVVVAATAALYLPRRLEVTAAILAIALAVMPVIATIRNINLLPSARAFAETWDRMDLDLRTTRGDRVVEAPETVGSLFFVTHDPAHWANQCVARYYSVASVRSH